MRRPNARTHAAVRLPEPLEPRRLLCTDHAALDPAEIARLNALPIDSPAPFDAERITGSHGNTSPGAPIESLTSTTILDNGPTSNRIDIVLVGDGYTAADLPTYAAHAQNAASNFFNEAPFNAYKSYFNIHRVDVISNQSGVDNDPTQGILRDTALDMGFFCSGIERLLCVNTTKARNAALSAPQVDQVLAIANSVKYGGAGYPGNDMGTFSGGNGSALEIARHEFGHSFADLADEYDYGDGATYTGGEPVALNVSKLTAANMLAQQQKWWRWLDLAEVDAFQGAQYYQFGLYRPTVNSKMRSLGRPWEAVNAEQLIISLYRTVRPIDSATPAGAYGATATFFVDPVDPLDHALSVQWLFDGQPIAGATGLTFDASTLGVTSGLHTLQVRVSDDTALVRDPSAKANLLTQTRTWTLDLQAPALVGGSLQFNARPQQVAASFDDNVAASLQGADLVLTNLSDGGSIVPAGAIALAGYNVATNTATFAFPGLPGARLADGNYRATFADGSVLDSAGNVLPSGSAFDFFFLNGDANRDRAVNLSDFSLMAGSFNQAVGVQFDDGDFDYSGEVGIADFAILAASYNKVLSPQESAGRAVFAVRPHAIGATPMRRDDERSDPRTGLDWI